LIVNTIEFCRKIERKGKIMKHITISYKTFQIIDYELWEIGIVIRHFLHQNMPPKTMGIELLRIHLIVNGKHTNDGNL
jgi:hypothetical protein